jgi:hypothetical protein
MKILNTLIIIIFLSHCSFDNKSGIWKNESNVSENKKNDIFEEFQTLSSSGNIFNEVIPLEGKLIIGPLIQKNNFKWNDVFYDKTNNLENFSYSDLNQTVFKSKKLSNSVSNKYILFENNNVISSDIKGYINIFSISDNKIINKFNFYGKRYKKIDKNLNLLIEDNIIYVSDNLGYLYAYNYLDNKIIWAKNYKVPFRSNLKIFKNKLIAANESNNLLFFEKTSGELLKSIPTEETTLKNEFKNNLSLSGNYLFFLNTYGSLYAIESSSMRVKWFISLNKTFDINPSNLFKGNQIVSKKDKIIVSANEYLYVLNAINGAVITKKNLTTRIKPVIIENYLFLVTKNNLLINFDLNTGKILYSYDINQKIAAFLNTKKKTVNVKTFMVANSRIVLFLNNSYILKFNFEGNLEKVDKLSASLNTQPIFINKSLLYLDYKNKLNIID